MTEISAIYLARQRDLNVRAANEVLRWKLSEVPADNLTIPDDSIAANEGTLTQIDASLDVSEMPLDDRGDTGRARPAIRMATGCPTWFKMCRSRA